MPPDRLEASAALLVRVWTEEGQPGFIRFRILAAAPGRTTQMLAVGQGGSQLIDAIRGWLGALEVGDELDRDGA